ncbi:UDP-N-acetylmuramoyl-L-alanyl-D-glutamate--2,6-diaminopimelate ligase [Tenuibacillus multivorans]|uniref:UDP-N-acetylmuramyl-tripeptide synthetase n=1 Tax=Tenuibacillus multivorans TaxID=237069 RepID=A0A1G9WQM7_9BACI|nr:UDP-N-acetylmuramoyl-L-alanyl-D-glutamate--2,6-diaminopimelate ligase [Tenuibacillus multivorans]GEL77970.1 UDP-N-acetylmuramoyl-L-alanyl-D-glutamate--2,6-diaminopimelate ligase [Tenuibacillus multivorans]SDM86740.1 UDP-N-acetylmuramoyl-L-alanyl-D-glutamate--2,6-diaminopimelate ligase [Tenuibacillus multivorans]
MKLTDLLEDCDVLTERNLADIDVKGLTDDSREIEPGYVFIAVQGYSHDGHQYIDEAIKRGASVIIGERSLSLDIPYVQVKCSKKVLGEMVSRFYGNPSKDKIVIGVTGSNGKTTTSYMIKAIFDQNGYRSSLIGTIEYLINGKSSPSKNTTPGAVSLQRMLYECEDDVIIIEVSSHALKQHRVAGIQFDTVIFTNLDCEHLDYHHSMEDYFKAKSMIFDLLKKDGQAIVNTDDEWGRKAYQLLLKLGKPVLTVGTKPNQDIRILPDQHGVYIKGNKADETLELKIPGLHNRYNAAFAIMVGELIGLERQKSIYGLNHVEKVDGRFQIVYFPGNKNVVIDYAHTPNGFYHCLNTIKQCGARRIIHVFGFRGMRDRSKRLMMMKQTLDVSDYYILTFDDLNGIDPKEMEKTLFDFNTHYDENRGDVITDRTLAIERAIELAREGDWVIITGKGHEQYKLDFEWGTKTDLETVETILHHTKELSL